MYFTVTFVASLLVSTSALVTPHAGDSIHRRYQHASLAKRAAAPAPVGQPLEASAAIPKRQLRKRCKPRKSSSALSATSAATSAASAPPNDPANVAPLPSSKDTTSHDAPSSSANPTPPPASSPSPSPAPQPSPSSSAAPAPSSSSGNGGQSGSLFQGTHTGDGTFYSTGLGACGITNNDSQLITAVSQDLFDRVPGYNGVNPNTNPVCHKKVRVSYQGRSVDVEITDRCVACLPTDLDLSPAAFNMLADPSVGRIHGMSWTWL